jgi:hypothetical protein
MSFITLFLLFLIVPPILASICGASAMSGGSVILTINRTHPINIKALSFSNYNLTGSHTVGMSEGHPYQLSASQRGRSKYFVTGYYKTNCWNAISGLNFYLVRRDISETVIELGLSPKLYAQSFVISGEELLPSTGIYELRASYWGLISSELKCTVRFHDVWVSVEQIICV